MAEIFNAFLSSMKEIDWIYVITFLVATISVKFLISFYKQRNKLQKQLDDFAKKSQLEQDLTFATSEQLMTEMAKRIPGFIFLSPQQTNNKNGTSMSIHISGVDPVAAVMLMQQACYVITSHPPTMIEPEGVDDGV